MLGQVRVTGRIFVFCKSKKLEGRVAASEKGEAADWYFLDETLGPKCHRMYLAIHHVSMHRPIHTSVTQASDICLEGCLHTGLLARSSERNACPQAAYGSVEDRQEGK